MNNKYEIKVDGRPIRLFQRGFKKTWYIRLKDGRRERLWSMKTDSITIAKVRARLACENLFAELFALKHSIVLSQSSQVPVSKVVYCGEIYDAYSAERFMLGINDPDYKIAKKSVAINLSAFEQIIRSAFPGKDWRKVNIDELLSDDVVPAWRRAKYKDNDLMFG